MIDHPLLNIQNATVLRDGNPILDNISLSIGLGEHTAIVGPNGSGKSTLIKLITRRYYPLAGAGQDPVVEIFGQSRWDIFQLQSQLGILSADLHNAFSNDNSLTGFETAISGFFASQGIAMHHVVTESMREKAEAALRLSNAWHLREKRLVKMSTGEVRRVLIARALVSDPKALLLDEPTTGLDIVAMHQFLTMVRQIAQSGRTILLVTHHIEEIIPEIQRVVLMKNGKIYRDGPKSEVLTSQNLSALFEAPISVDEIDHHYTVKMHQKNLEIFAADGNNL